MVMVRNICVAIAALHLLVCELIATGLWAPAHADGFVALTIFSVALAIMLTFLVFVDAE